MGDPFLNFAAADESDIQVNVFRVKGRLGDPSMRTTEKYKLLQSDCYIFGKKPDQEIHETGAGTKKIVDEQIYLSDTMEIVLSKIALSCVEEDISGKDIFAWQDRNTSRKKKLFRFSYPLGLGYPDIDEFINPFLDEQYDKRFANIDGSVKRNPKYSLDYYSSYGSYLELGADTEYNIYFCTVSDVYDYLAGDTCFPALQALKGDILMNGYIRKFFPLHGDGDSGYLSKVTAKMNFMSSQKALQGSFKEQPSSCRPDILVYKNPDKESAIDIFKIFKSLELTEEVPYMRIQIDSYMDSYIKLNKQIINTRHQGSETNTLTKDIFEKWNRGISLQNGFVMPKLINKTNTLTLIIYDKKTRSHVSLVIYTTGSVEMYVPKIHAATEFQHKNVNKARDTCNKIIRKINQNKEFSPGHNPIPSIFDRPSRVDISYLYDIPDFNSGILIKPFLHLLSEFIVIEADDEAPIHMLYCKSDNYENESGNLDFITILRKKDLQEDRIIELLSDRYNTTPEVAKETLESWNRMNLTNPMRLNTDGTISVFIQKAIDGIKVSLIGISSYAQLHEIMKTINFVMGIYKEKKINKNKSLPQNVSDLFRKSRVKNIRTKAIAPEPEAQDEPEPATQDEQIEPEPEPQDEQIEPEPVAQDESDDESESEESESDEYEGIQSSDSQSGGGAGTNKQRKTTRAAGGDDDDGSDESKYPNKRYYIKRLEQRDPGLIKFKTKTSGDGYAYKCQAAQDKQPIVLTTGELKDMDRRTGLKNEGKSYTKAERIEGTRNSDLRYICPKFWDRKNQIALDPTEIYHPLETDLSGEKTIEYRDYVWDRGMKDNDKYILERTGRPAHRGDSDSYWNKDPIGKDIIGNYNVQFIHDVHPDHIAVPCCGKKQTNISQIDVNVLQIDKANGNHWAIGKICGDINVKDEYLVNIDGKKKLYHISLLRAFKGSSDRMTYDLSLKKNSNGHIHPILKDLFNVRRDSPSLSASDKKSKNGFYRKGITQGYDSFLECIDTIHCINRNNATIKRFEPNLALFKKNILLDMADDDFDVDSVAGGAFVQYFRDKYKHGEVSVQRRPVNSTEIIESVMINFEKWLNSTEVKNERLMVPLLMKISELKDNKTFEERPINIVVFSENNEKIKVAEPIGKITFIDEAAFAFIYKSGDTYEPLIYYYEGSSYGYVLNQRDTKDLVKGNDIEYDDNTIAEVLQITKTKCKIQIKDVDDKIEIDLKETSLSDLKKYDMKSIIDIVIDFVDSEASKVQHTNKEIITEEDLYRIMNSVKEFKGGIGSSTTDHGYYDTYNRVIFVGRDKGLTLPIRPKSLSDKSHLGKSRRHCSLLPKQDARTLLLKLAKIDKLIEKEYGDKYELYGTDSKIIVDKSMRMKGLLLSCGLILPLDGKPYHRKFKLDPIYCPSLMKLQSDYLIGKPSSDKLTEYYADYNDNNEELYRNFTETYNEISKNKSLKEALNAILNHRIKLPIHKREEALILLSEHRISGENNSLPLKGRDLKKMIEYLLIHGLNGINRHFIHEFISLKDMKISNHSDHIAIFTMKEIIDESYDYLFEIQSDYIRDISFYNEFNPDVQRHLLKKAEVTKFVSFHTKYPNILRKIFASPMKVLKNVIASESNDIQIISHSLVPIFPEMNHDRIKRDLKAELQKNERSYHVQDVLLGRIGSPDEYRNKVNFEEDFDDIDYNLTLHDLELLSSLLKVGFVLFTNRYTNKDTQFKTYITIHKECMKSDIDDIELPMLCFYQDWYDEKDMKSIEIDGSALVNLKDLMKNGAFKKIVHNTYKTGR